MTLAARLIRLGLLVAASFLILAPTAPAQVVAPAAAPEVKVRGRLETVDGLRVLSVWGSADEQAFAEGWHFAADIVRMFDGYFGSDRVTGGMSWDKMMRPIILKRFDFPVETKAWAKALHQGITNRMGAAPMSQKLGRALEPEDLLVAVAFPDLIGLMCSSFAAFGPLAPDEGTIVGRNLDYIGTKELMQETVAIVHAADEKRHGWVAFGYPGFAGCLTGVNDAGVFVSIHDVMKKPMKGKHTFTPRFLALRDLMESSEPSADLPKLAREKLSAHRYALGGNGMLAWWKEGQAGAVVLEFDDRDHQNDGRCTARGPDSGKTYVLCSNHHRSRVAEKIDACTRYSAVDEALSKRSTPLDLASAWETIAKSTVDITLHRLVVDLKAGIAEFQYRPEPKAPFTKAARLSLRTLLAAAK